MTEERRFRSLDEQLRFAIANRHLLQFRYNGARRVAEPHDYGVQNGSVRLLVFQQKRSDGADSQSRQASGWRLLEVAKLLECSVLDATFEGSRGEGYDRHYRWDVVFARVS